MPAVNETSRAIIGLHQRRCAGNDPPSRLARRVLRFGSCPRAAPSRISNQLCLMLLATTALPRAMPAGAGVLTAPARPFGLLPMAAAAHTVDVAPAQADTPRDRAADALLLSGTLPTQVVNGLAEAAVQTCVLSPRRCGNALLGAAAGGLLGAGGVLGAQWLWPGARPERVPYHLIDDALPASPRFDPRELDPSAPPCQSLGAHVNSRWEHATLLARSRTRLGTFDQLRDRSLLIRAQLAEQIAAQPAPTPGEKVIGDLWVTGMDHARIEAAGLDPLRPALARIAQIKDRQALQAWLFDATHRGRNPLFRFSALPDLDDPSHHLAYLGQDGLGLEDSTSYDDPAMADIVDAYLEHIARMLALSGMPTDQAARQADNVLALERELASASEPLSRLAADFSPFFNPVNVAEANAQTPGIDWKQFFQQQGMQPPARFSLGMPGFFRRVGELLQTVPLDTWKAYVQFHAMDRAAPCLASAQVQAHTAFHGAALKGRKAQVPHWARVLDLIERSAGEALSPAFVAATLPPSTVDQVHSLASAVTASLRDRLQANPWMDDDARQHALQKAATLRVDVGHPAQWPDWTGVGTTRGSFLHNVDAVDAHVHRRNIALIGQPVDPSQWKLTAQTVDAYHDVTQNRIVLPAAMLHPPFFDPQADAALNFGGIGVVIGHEMAHAFDSLGSLFDAHGQSVDGWSPPVRQRFDALAEQLTQQFNAQRFNGKPIDGALTLDENLADLGGMAIALQAMQRATADVPDPMIDGLSREQRFFANFALSSRMIVRPERVDLELATSPHVPGAIRADGAPSNLPAFATAFNCTVGSPMARPQGERVHFL